MVIDGWDYPIILTVGVFAGMVNSVAGGGTLITFPTLVWLGRDPILANATNTLALWPGSVAGMLGFRRYLQGSRNWLVLLSIPSVLGGVFGAFLLLQTPSETFSYIVPYLILVATLLLALQEPLQHLLLTNRSHNETRLWWAGALFFQFLVAVYGGYFGAGIGIMMLAVLGLLRLTDIYQMNGLKNFFAFCINGVAAVYFAAAGSVSWVDATVMAVGAIAGGYGGASLAQKLGRRAVRFIAVGVGFAMTVSLFLKG
ncbi:MAG TPA: sulfite exporter TauE/SafE family protein [Acidobacteriota bacterium]|nr:sulfite exporter TauE/SafE family protein [Acidobacteriota bacterium]